MAEREENFEEIFPVGVRVRCESEMYPGKWEYGVVKAHSLSRYNDRMGIVIETDTALVEYDYRYLDSNPHNSLVRLVK